MSVLRSTSQPVAALPSQLPKFGLQVMLQVPPEQLAVPFVELQALGQAPQWLGSVERLASQPFVALPSQLPNPGLHSIPQVPALQLRVPFVELHALGQAPQCAGSFVKLTSQPLAGLPSQSANPGLH